MYPLKMLPYYRHGNETPWGGSQLRDVFGKDIPDDLTGESLEVSALSGRESVVANGEYAGKTLSEMIELSGEALTGQKDNAVFPLLLKLLDARDMLSVQVHPNDEYAMRRHGKLGKTEAWVILSAPKDAKIVFGVKNDAPLRDAVEGGRLEEMLNWVKVVPGDVLYIPYGMVHALGGGLLVYEIQQSSDVTYRFYDWGRGRELHTEDALNVSRPSLEARVLHGATVLCAGGSRTAYISDKNFELWRLNVSGKMPIDAGRMRFLTAMGRCTLSWADGRMELLPGETVVVPAKCADVCIEGKLSVLCSSLPDQENMRREMGNRQYEIAGLCESAAAMP